MKTHTEAEKSVSQQTCSQCGSIGVYYDPQVEAGRHGSLKLCSCVVSQCRCGSRPPFQYWDEQGQNQWCACRVYRRRMGDISRLFRQADIPERYRWKFQDDFNSQAPDGTPVRGAQELRAQVATLIDSQTEPHRGFLLFGQPGTGKTLLGCIMLNELLLHRGRAGRFLNLSRKYFQQLRDTYSEDSEQYGHTWQILDTLCNLPYLILDDFGVQRGTEWEMEMLYDLVDARYGDERFTIITTNQPLEEIKRLAGGRIYSRLIEMCHQVEMTGEDYRQHLQARR